MTQSGPPPVGSARWALALALLRFGSDTRAARALKQLAPRGTPPVADLPGRLAHALGIAPPDLAGRRAEAWSEADRALERARTGGLTLISWFDPAYPPLLAEICDPPIAFWLSGDESSIAKPAVAIVGSRRAAPAGVRLARSLAAGLASAGLSIVSGLARGIDGAAHEGALDAGGVSIAVLGSGADVIYPAEHRALAERLRASGALVSEFLPGTPPRPHHFPLRNRIISGLCRAVIVVEASERSGSLITARLALEQGRDVLAVPGTVASGQYAGCHALIKDGAPLVETVQDVLDAVGWMPAGAPQAIDPPNSREISNLESFMAAGEAYSIEDLAARTGLSAPELLSRLGMLEVAGVVGRLPGAGFVKFDKSVIGGSNG